MTRWIGRVCTCGKLHELQATLSQVQLKCSCDSGCRISYIVPIREGRQINKTVPRPD